MLKQLNIEQIDQLQSYIEERRVVMNPALIGRVSAILEDVRMHGDEAVLRYTKQFDGMELNKLRVSSEELMHKLIYAHRNLEEACSRPKKISYFIIKHKYQKAIVWKRKWAFI